MSLELSGTTGLKGVAGSVSAPSIVGDDTNTGISFPAADTIKFSTGGVERMSITNSGVTGVGGNLRQHKIISKSNHSSTTSLTPSIIPDFSITITPTASDSIMVIEASMYFSITQHVISTRIYNGTTQVIQPNTFDSNDDGNSSYYIGDQTDRMVQQDITSFETSGNTNARTYSVYWRVSSGTAYINRYVGSDSYNGVSTLKVYEVAP